jgi:hypothetical protein
MKRCSLILLFALTHLCVVKGQSLDRSLAFEIGGSGGLGSLNYEKLLEPRERGRFLWRIGISGVPIDANSGFVITIPVSFGGLFGSDRHFLEWGVGQGISFTTKGSFFARTIPCLGYRFMPAQKRFYWGIKYTPLISYLLDFQYENWAGITLGYRL